MAVGRRGVCVAMTVVGLALLGACGDTQDNPEAAPTTTARPTTTERPTTTDAPTTTERSNDFTVDGECSTDESVITVTASADATAISGVLFLRYTDGDTDLGEADTGPVVIKPGVNTFTIPTPANVTTAWEQPGAELGCSVHTRDLRPATDAEVNATTTTAPPAPMDAATVAWWNGMTTELRELSCRVGFGTVAITNATLNEATYDRLCDGETPPVRQTQGPVLTGPEIDGALAGPAAAWAATPSGPTFDALAAAATALMASGRPFPPDVEAKVAALTTYPGSDLSVATTLADLRRCRSLDPLRPPRRLVHRWATGPTRHLSHGPPGRELLLGDARRGR